MKRYYEGLNEFFALLAVLIVFKECLDEWNYI